MASARLKGQIRAAVEAGEELKHYASNLGRDLRRGARKIKLLNADGTSTPAGAHYYEEVLGLPKPTLDT
jgi:hypothetical protein